MQQKELKELLSKRNINESVKNEQNELTDNKLKNR
jgi:hypothetical protein